MPIRLPIILVLPTTCTKSAFRCMCICQSEEEISDTELQYRRTRISSVKHTAAGSAAYYTGNEYGSISGEHT